MTAELFCATKIQQQQSGADYTELIEEEEKVTVLVLIHYSVVLA